jgi:hypothetical protein
MFFVPLDFLEKLPDFIFLFRRSGSAVPIDSDLNVDWRASAARA